MKGNNLLHLTRELIAERTGFQLTEVFPDFAAGGRISPDLHEERERFAAELGEDNVLTSMYLDDQGVIQLGIFTKDPLEDEPSNFSVGHDGTPIDFMSEEFDR